MIEVSNLCKSYGDFTAIDDLNFEIPKGKVVGLLGPNGAGKTTTMKIITGFMAPTSGSVKMNGVDLYDDPIYIKQRLGYLPEAPPLYLDMKVIEYLKFVASLKGVEKQSISNAVDQAIDKTKLNDVSLRRIAALSKGFKQRVGLAQAIVSNPELLILDEPTVGLDPMQVQEVRGLVQSLRSDHTIIVSTHILSEVQATCDDVLILNKGKIVTQSSIEDLTKLQLGKCIVSVKTLNSMNSLLKELTALQGVVSIEQINESHLDLTMSSIEKDIANLSEFIVKSGSGLLELKMRSQNLEDIFIQLVDKAGEVSNG